jgi:hypothetical protein
MEVNIMSEANNLSRKEANPEFEEIEKKIDHLVKAENKDNQEEEDQEIDFADLTNVSGGWECSACATYKTQSLSEAE